MLVSPNHPWYSNLIFLLMFPFIFIALQISYMRDNRKLSGALRGLCEKAGLCKYFYVVKARFVLSRKHRCLFQSRLWDGFFDGIDVHLRPNGLADTVKIHVPAVCPTVSVQAYATDKTMLVELLCCINQQKRTYAFAAHSPLAWVQKIIDAVLPADGCLLVGTDFSEDTDFRTILDLVHIYHTRNFPSVNE